jgi:hypothetical protein
MMDDADQAIIQRLDKTYALLRLAFAPQLEEARASLVAEPVTAAILGASSDWILSKKLQESVAKATGKSERTVLRRLPELVEQGVLASRGSEQRTEYRRSGLV